MATNHIDRRRSTPPAVYKQQFFVLCGPPPAGKRKALARLLRKHWWVLVLLALLGIIMATYGWAMYDFVGATTLYDWRCEGMAGGLSLFTIYLHRTFRRWGLERKQRVMAQRKRSQEINALLCTPPPLSPTVQITPEPEFVITIERWNSHEPTLVDEDKLTTALPDEIIAPDALALKVEVKKAA